MFPSIVLKPGCSASWPVWLQKTVMPRHSCAWLVLLVTIQLALCSLSRGWTCPLCATSGAGRVCAQLWSSAVASWSDVNGGFWKNLLYFLRECVLQSRGRFSPRKSGHYFYKQYVAVASATEAFGRISGVSSCECGLVSWGRFWACPGAVRTKKSGHYSYDLSDDV